MACVVKRRGKYVIDFYDNQGTRHWKTLPEGTTKVKAKAALRDIELQLEKGVYLPASSTPTFHEVAKRWIEHKKPNLRPTTWEVYEGHIRNHFHDFDSLRINRITTGRIEKYITARQEQGINLMTLRKVLVTLGQIMSYAVRHQLIDHNPVRDAERPKGQGKEEEKRITVFTLEEIGALLKAVTDKKYHALFMLAIMSGARQGELLGLKWEDILWHEKQIQIQRTFNKGRWFAPKTKGSTRRIDIGPAMMKILKEWRLACLPNELDLVFPNEAGQPMNYSNMVNRYFFPALKAAGIPRMKFHALRHTTASIMIEQGENVKYIQTQLGHSSPTVTLNVYAHLMKQSNQEAACRFENSVFETTGSKMVAGQ